MRRIWTTALALSIGWGIRGQWGHEAGALIPGALAGITAALLSERREAIRRWLWIGFFGAVGWSFGGSMSYGLVLGYTQTGRWQDVLYGFLMLFVLGWLWGFLGGAGTALPVNLDRKRLASILPPLGAVFAVWAVYDLFLGFELNWFDSDWIGVSLALATGLAWWRWKGRSLGTDLVVWLSAGWWAGFLLFPVALGLRMTAPRGDNWAGVLGMCAALGILLWRERLPAVLRAAFQTAAFAGAGFAIGQWIKVIGVHFIPAWNWHSVMEQSFGFIAGIGIGFVPHESAGLPFEDKDPIPAWCEPALLLFLLIAMTWLNISKNFASVWVPAKVVPEKILGAAPIAWFAVAYAVVAATIVVSLRYVARNPVPWLPENPLGRGILFVVLLMWWVVLGNAVRILPFHSGRLITEGVIHINACLWTALLLTAPWRQTQGAATPRTPWRWALAPFGGLALAALLTASVLPL